MNNIGKCQKEIFKTAKQLNKYIFNNEINFKEINIIVIPKNDEICDGISFPYLYCDGKCLIKIFLKKECDWEFFIATTINTIIHELIHIADLTIQHSNYSKKYSEASKSKNGCHGENFENILLKYDISNIFNRENNMMAYSIKTIKAISKLKIKEKHFKDFLLYK